ncbi:hypothetical protein VRK_34760 [Vibrio sp. MEBiC08052]|nr:hypothetical protein VRK_34760 [Vibrio sp. MEBiC08052]
MFILIANHDFVIGFFYGAGFTRGDAIGLFIPPLPAAYDELWLL